VRGRETCNDLIMSSTITTPSEIIAKLRTAFDNALSTKSLHFFPSTIHSVSQFGIEVTRSLSLQPNLTPSKLEIRLCPALQNKSTSDAPSQPRDPFAAPYDQNLLVGELKDSDAEQEYAILVLS
jgi:sulfate adenylyltransferase (ADP) / ATP adenylyltransferase